MRYFVYIVCCFDGTFYTGITTDIVRRIRQHNGEIVGGAKYTRARSPVTLVYEKSYKDRSTASQEEIRIKKLTREKKEILIKTYK